jgi:hypothetical protein
MLSLLALGAVALVGCDNDDYERRPPPRDQVDVRDFEVEFDVDEADFEGAIASAAFEAPELTPEVVDNGLVMAYVRVTNVFGDDTWRALPYTYGVEFEDPDTDEEPPVDYTVTLGFAYEVDFFEVFYELSAYDDFVWDQLAERGPRRIRVVAFTEAAARSNAALDFDDYEAVQERFDLNP